MLQRRKLLLQTGFILCLLLGLSAGSVFAQTATLSGKVTDAQSGEGLTANVVVTAAGVRTGASCDPNGMYTVSNLAPGTYTVTVTILSHETRVQTVTLAAGDSKVLNIGLTESGIELNAVVISASRKQEKVLEAPAAISVLEQSEIRREVSPSATAILRNLTGVDMAKTGIDREEIVLRGFNNAFSGATYVLTDYRQSAVASLGVNLYSIMPNNSIDLERVEVVRGPGSALYGAGVDAGVIHYLTLNPFSHPGTSVSLGGGERSLYNVAFRQAGVISEKVGYKITGNYAQANDWELNSSDALDAAQLASDRAGLKRNYDYEKYNVNAMLQFRLSDGVTLTGAGGYSALDATVLSGIGTVQAEDFGYSYGQLRLQANKFFAQAYLNRNSAGKSFVYGTGVPVVDNSILFTAQAQYDLDFSEGRHKVIIGADFDRTTPDTEGTIYGRNENNDQISELGGYVQASSALSSKFDLTLAARADYNNIQENVRLSPRVAMVFKASPENVFRATYNRAFSSPGNNSLFLDIAGRTTFLSPTGLRLILQGRGSIDGFTFNNFRQNQTATLFIPATGVFGRAFSLSQYPVRAVYGFTAGQIAALFAGPESGVPRTLRPFNAKQRAAIAGLLAQVAGRTLPTATTAAVLGIPDGTQQLGYRRVAGPLDVEPLKQTTSNTFELGYKGIFSKRVLFAIDGYYTTKKNFVGPLLVESPFAYLPVEFVGTDVGRIIVTALAGGDTSIAGLIGRLGLPPADAIRLLTGVVGTVASGVVQPDQSILPTSDPTAVGGLLAYRNFGNIEYYGIDATIQVLASNRLNLFGNISYVNDDFFDNKELDEAGTSLELALNAPTFKAKGGFAYSVPLGIAFNGSARYTKGFPVRSGPYVGDVENYFLVDVGAGYDMGKYVRGMNIDVSVQNVLNNEHREFIGAPLLGRLAAARVNFNF